MSRSKTAASLQTVSLQTVVDLGAATPAPADVPNPRYERVALLGSGGMGEVYEVRDRLLNRTVAMKVIRFNLASDAEYLARFLEEAQIAGQLDHPGIAPVFDYGREPGGHLYFTMKIVRGVSLRDILSAFHADVKAGAWPAAGSTWTLSRLLGVFRRVIEAVSYAHARGVLHRDLKPGNVMVGDFGEVYVMDWGIAKPLGDRPTVEAQVDPVATTPRSTGDLNETGFGRAIGTLSYMSPEQARGDVSRLGPASDVYALGVILNEIFLGQLPFGAQAIVRPRHVEPLHLRIPAGHPPIPMELAAVCDRALAFDPADRYPHAGAMLTDVAAWFDGATRREQALAEVATAREQLPAAREMRREAEAYRQRARLALDALPAHADVAARRDAWAAQDRAAELSVLARVSEVQATQRLFTALSLVPELPEARALLALQHRDRLVDAEAAGDAASAAEHALLVRTYDQGILAAWLDGDGPVTLHTDPPGATVSWHRLEARDRCLEPIRVRELGRTPLDHVLLPRGAHLLVARLEGFEPLIYPVFLERSGAWTGVPPGGWAARPIPLLTAGAPGPEAVYIPAGSFACGGDPHALDSLPRQTVWVDAFVMARDAVTMGEYAGFIRWVAALRGGDAALALAPALVAAADEEPIDWAAVAAGSDVPEGRARCPVNAIDWHSACAYARWRAQRDGLPWRLPHEIEWEKAARGVDGRAFPWGDAAERCFANVAGSLPGIPRPLAVGSFEKDGSPYGVRDLGGNMRAWCQNLWRPDGGIRDGVIDFDAPQVEADEYRAARGGAWKVVQAQARVCGRFGARPNERSTGCGVRLVRGVVHSDRQGRQ